MDNHPTKKPEPDLIKRYEDLLARADASEQDYQEFIEDNTTLFYPAHELNHGVHAGALISKLQLDTTLTTDFAYLTKSSAVWWAVLVELEHPTKQLFTREGKASAQLNAAIHQVRTWRTLVKRRQSEMVARFDPLRKPLTRNKVLFKYVLVIGRTTEFQADQAKVDAFEELQQDDFRVVTYDSLLSNYKHRPNAVLDVLSQKGQKFTFKKRHRDDTRIFTWLSSNDIHLESAEVEHFKSMGYDMDRWLGGELLVVDGKKTEDQFVPTLVKSFQRAGDPPGDAKKPSA